MDVITMAKQQARSVRPPRRGRPPTPKMQKLSAQRMVRFDPMLDSAVEVRRRQMEHELGEPVDFSKAIRDLVRAGAAATGLIPGGGGGAGAKRAG